MKILIIISYWQQRSRQPLLHLLSQIQQIPSGYPFDLMVVCNSDIPTQLSELDNLKIPYIIRENKGLNIGAWEQGWRTFPDYDYHLFLQDDCFIIRPHWLIPFIKKFSQSEHIGLLGESLNWQITWEELAQSSYNKEHKDHLLDNKPSKKIDFYRHFLAKHHITEGITADHLQSIIWFTSRSILEQINGFLIAQNYGEAIAVEIAISKQVQNLGYQIAQINPHSCYHYIAHPQWFLRKRKLDRLMYGIRRQIKPIFASSSLDQVKLKLIG